MREQLRMLGAGCLAIFLCGVGAAAQSGAAVKAAAHKAVAKTAAKPPMVAATPPMGWNSWNFFAGKVTDKDIRDTADLLVSTGMRDAGYVYVNIDDTWEGDRDAQGRIQSNSKFPDMKALADYVHSKGLKLGIYSSPGAKTCARFEASLGHEEQDAQTYADWGVDYLKYDLCSYRTIMEQQAPGDIPAQYKLMRQAYEKMHQAILKTGRPMVYSLCQYGWDSVWEWGPSVGANLWRTTGRHLRQLRPHERHRSRSGRPRQVRRPRPLERPRHARGRQRQAHPRRKPHPHVASGPCSPRLSSPATTSPR